MIVSAFLFIFFFWILWFVFNFLIKDSLLKAIKTEESDINRLESKIDNTIKRIEFLKKDMRSLHKEFFQQKILTEQLERNHAIIQNNNFFYNVDSSNAKQINSKTNQQLISAKTFLENALNSSEVKDAINEYLNK